MKFYSNLCAVLSVFWLAWFYMTMLSCVVSCSALDPPKALVYGASAEGSQGFGTTIFTPHDVISPSVTAIDYDGFELYSAELRHYRSMPLPFEALAYGFAGGGVTYLEDIGHKTATGSAGAGILFDPFFCDYSHYWNTDGTDTGTWRAGISVPLTNDP